MATHEIPTGKHGMLFQPPGQLGRAPAGHLLNPEHGTRASLWPHGVLLPIVPEAVILFVSGADGGANAAAPGQGLLRTLLTLLVAEKAGLGTRGPGTRVDSGPKDK